MSLHALLVIALAILGLTAAKSVNGLYEENDLVVSLNSPSGSKIRGIALKSPKGKDYYAYLDIPYADTTSGNNRFQEPKPKKAWQGILNTTVNSKICPQEGAGEVTEDCLVLNVYTTKHPTATGSKLPVLVWIHGGVFLIGAGSEYDPKFFIDENLVVITINYRLGVLGFLNTEDGVIPANLGLKDQRLAIDWVSKNIEQFGGDSKNIKISGQSAGAVSVGLHLLGKRNVPIHGAILASGSPLSWFAFQLNSKGHALEVAKAIKTDFNSSDSSDVLELLRSATIQEILNAGGDVFSHVRFIPAPEKEFSVAPTDDLDNGRMVKVPTLFGFNSEEMLSLLNKQAIDTSRQNASLDFGSFLESNFEIDFGNDTELAGKEAKRVYTNTEFSEELFVKMESDMNFNIPIARHAESTSKYIKDTYMYRLSYRYSLSPDGAVPGMQGVGHQEDLPLLWGISPLSAQDDKIMSEKMVKIWANFVRSNQPHNEDDEYWPPVNQKVVSFMDLDVTGNNLQTNPRNYQEIKKIFNKYLTKPITIF